jgi:type II secretory pathway pseudopilin PulG
MFPFSIARFPRPAIRGFTLAEMMVSLGASVIVIGALLLSAVSLRRALNSNRIYAEAYSDQRRLTDYIGRDLRRAVAVAFTDSDGVRTEVAGTPSTVLIADRATLIVTLPAYYRGNARTDANYEAPLEVVADQQRLDYGTPAGLAPPVEVSFRKIFYGREGCVCFVRQEAGTEEVIVRNAESLFVQVSIAASAQESSIKTWFRSSQLGPAPLVSTYDRLLLRNPPLTYRP